MYQRVLTHNNFVFYHGKYIDSKDFPNFHLRHEPIKIFVKSSQRLNLDSSTHYLISSLLMNQWYIYYERIYSTYHSEKGSYKEHLHSWNKYCYGLGYLV